MPAFRSSISHVIPSGSGTTAVALPAGATNNDFIVVSIAGDGSYSIAPNGYTKLFNTFASSVSGVVAYKRITSDTTATISKNTFFDLAVVIQAFTGVNKDNPIDNSYTETTGASGDPNPGSHTTVTDNCLRVVTGHYDANVAGSVTAPSGYSDLDDEEATSSATVMVASKAAGVAGPENPASFSTPDSDGWIASHFALRPFVAAIEVDTVGTLGIVGNTPVVSDSTNIVISAIDGELQIVGNVPVVDNTSLIQNISVTIPAAGTLEITGNVPIVTDDTIDIQISMDGTGTLGISGNTINIVNFLWVEIDTEASTETWTELP